MNVIGKYLKDEDGNYISPIVSVSTVFDENNNSLRIDPGLPVGSGCDYYGTTAPEGYLFADGSAVSRTEYAELFEVLGTTYGAGDGSTTFNLPDKRERVSIMANTSNAIDLLDMQTKTLSDGSKWARIFYHNSKGGTVLFSTVQEARNTQTADKYSRLYLLDDDTFKKNMEGKFELMLCYPTDSTTKYNRWKQTNSPCNEYYTPTTSGTKVTGYEAIHIDWTTNYWGGLGRFNKSTTEITQNCYLTGAVGTQSWWYAIAPITAYNGGMPSSNGVTTNDVEIWIRYDNLLYIGGIGGEKTHTLTINEMPSHTHIQNAHNHTIFTYKFGGGVAAITASNQDNYNTKTGTFSQINSATATNQNTGGGYPHNNLQPYLICNYIIKAYSIAANSTSTILAALE